MKMQDQHLGELELQTLGDLARLTDVQTRSYTVDARGRTIAIDLEGRVDGDRVSVRVERNRSD